MASKKTNSFIIGEDIRKRELPEFLIQVGDKMFKELEKQNDAKKTSQSKGKPKKEKPKNVYILDICAVSVTKLSGVITDLKKREIYERLRSSDKRKNRISYLCAFLEKISDTRGKMTLEELKVQIKVDLEALNKFFRHAKVIEGIVGLLIQAEKLFEQPIELDRDKYFDFMKMLNNEFQLLNPVSSTLRLERANEIILSAINLGIAPQHVLVCSALACLCGNSEIQRMMKFKKDPTLYDHTNVYADIMNVPRFARTKLMIKKKFPITNVEFVTGDEGLKILMKHYHIKAANNISQGVDFQSVQYIAKPDIKPLLMLTEANETVINQIVDLQLNSQDYILDIFS
ncbi:hypothetical protein F889_01542 [Acinetobacter colistiniresistens]|uniref:Uncharacterized protein n=1 Tax=Acinetobacter colistiniresistens TaxID=280145 RepID=N9R6X5_9GAMM|nr:hypothetical protein [Acinetobacter colistiniresistens]ENX34902.1 hypothetical protein F889_01542 [Acinetobacter colistiniresistens]